MRETGNSLLGGAEEQIFSCVRKSDASGGGGNRDERFELTAEEEEEEMRSQPGRSWGKREERK